MGRCPGAGGHDGAGSGTARKESTDYSSIIVLLVLIAMGMDAQITIGVCGGTRAWLTMVVKEIWTCFFAAFRLRSRNVIGYAAWPPPRLPAPHFSTPHSFLLCCLVI